MFKKVHHPQSDSNPQDDATLYSALIIETRNIPHVYLAASSCSFIASCWNIGRCDISIPQLIGNMVLDELQWIPMDKLMDSLEIISCPDVIAVLAVRLKD